MKKILLVSSALMAILAATNLWAGDIAAGKAAVEKNGCVACHGVDLKSPMDPTYPKLAGQNQDYLVHSLVAYQRGNGVANGRSNAIMSGQAKLLSLKDIDNIAAYIHSLPGDLVVRK